MAIEYIYPSWIKAKRDLSEALKLTHEQKDILNDWFKHHCFEYGASTAVHRREIGDPERKENIEYHVTRSNLGKIMQTLADKGLVQQSQINHDEHMRIYETRILIFGYSPLGIGDAVRKASK